MLPMARRVYASGRHRGRHATLRRDARRIPIVPDRKGRRSVPIRCIRSVR